MFCSPRAGASDAYPSLHVQHVASQEWDGTQEKGKEPYTTRGRSLPGEHDVLITRGSLYSTIECASMCPSICFWDQYWSVILSWLYTIFGTPCTVTAYGIYWCVILILLPLSPVYSLLKMDPASTSSFDLPCTNIIILYSRALLLWSCVFSFFIVIVWIMG